MEEGISESTVQTGGCDVCQVVDGLAVAITACPGPHGPGPGIVGLV